MNNIRKILAAMAVSCVIAFSSQLSAQESITNVELRKVIESIKLEIAQHPGIQAYYDEKSKIVTLSGSTDDNSFVRGLISKLESFDHVKEVRSSVTKD